MRKVAFITLLWGPILIASLWLGGFLAFSAQAPLRSVGAAEAAVVLTGGAKRIEAAVALLDEGRVGRLLISGVNIQVSTGDLEKIVGIDAEKLTCCIDIGRSARNTQGNAVETANWVRANEYESVVVITADYHMPRSMVILSHAMPDTKLMPYSVEAPASLYGRAKEYTKYVVTMVGARLHIGPFAA